MLRNAVSQHFMPAEEAVANATYQLLGEPPAVEANAAQETRLRRSYVPQHGRNSTVRREDSDSEEEHDFTNTRMDRTCIGQLQALKGPLYAWNGVVSMQHWHLDITVAIKYGSYKPLVPMLLRNPKQAIEALTVLIVEH